MPVIREYQRQTGALGPINQPAYSADQFGAAEGRAMENLGGAITNVADTVAKRLDQENTSDVTQKLTKANADLAIDLQERLRKAEPGDKTVFEEYDKKVEETLGKIGEEASTVSARAFYGEASARIKAQLSQTSASGQAELAGIKAVTDYQDTINNLSSAAVADPSSIGLQRDLHRQAINNLVVTGQLPREKAIQLEQQGETALAKATVRGWIQLNPNYAKEKLKTGEFDKELGAEGKIQLLGEVEQAERAQEIEQERQIRAQERIVKKQQQQTQNDFLQAMMDKNLTAKDILNSNLDAFGSGSKEQFLEMLKKANSPEDRLKTDASTMITLFNRIHLPDGDPNKLVNENELNHYFGRGISMADLKQLRDEMQGKETEAGKVEADMKKQVLAIAKGKLTRSNELTGFRDPIGDEQMARFMAFFLEEYKTRRAKGESPMALLSPDSPQYLGKNIDQYVRSNQQIMRDLSKRRNAPANTLTFAPSVQPADAAPRYTPPAKKVIPKMDGESAADYLKRIKGGG